MRKQNFTLKKFVLGSFSLPRMEVKNCCCKRYWFCYCFRTALEQFLSSLVISQENLRLRTLVRKKLRMLASFRFFEMWNFHDGKVLLASFNSTIFVFHAPWWISNHFEVLLFFIRLCCLSTLKLIVNIEVRTIGTASCGLPTLWGYCYSCFSGGYWHGSGRNNLVRHNNVA